MSPAARRADREVLASTCERVVPRSREIVVDDELALEPVRERRTLVPLGEGEPFAVSGSAADSSRPASTSKEPTFTYERGASALPVSRASSRLRIPAARPSSRRPLFARAMPYELSACASAARSPFARAMVSASSQSGSAASGRPLIAQRAATVDSTSHRVDVGPLSATSSSAL